MNSSREWDTSALPAALDQECHSIVKDLGGVKINLSDVPLLKVSPSISKLGRPTSILIQQARYCKKRQCTARSSSSSRSSIGVAKE